MWLCLIWNRWLAGVHAVARFIYTFEEISAVILLSKTINVTSVALDCRPID